MCSPVFSSCLVPRPRVAGGGGAVPWGTDRRGRSTRDGAGPGEAVRKVSPRPESRTVVGPAGEPEPLRIAHSTAAVCVAQRDWSRRYARAPSWPEDHRQGLLTRGCQVVCIEGGPDG